MFDKLPAFSYDKRAKKSQCSSPELNGSMIFYLHGHDYGYEVLTKTFRNADVELFLKKEL